MPKESEPHDVTKLPPRKLYRHVAKRLFELEIRIGRECLPHEVQYLNIAAAFHGETLNGGMVQYFTNSSGKDYKLALVALRVIGATLQAKLALKWLKQLPSSVSAEDPKQVGRCVFGDPHLARTLASIDREYFEAAGVFYEKFAGYVKLIWKVLRPLLTS